MQDRLCTILVCLIVLTIAFIAGLVMLGQEPVRLPRFDFGTYFDPYGLVYFFIVLFANKMVTTHHRMSRNAAD